MTGKKHSISYTEYALSRNKKDTREYSKDTQLLKILLKHTTSKMKSKMEMKAGGTEHKIWENIIEYFCEEVQHWSK